MLCQLLYWMPELELPLLSERERLLVKVAGLPPADRILLPGKILWFQWLCINLFFFRYPSYEFISDNSISWSAGLHNRYTENSLRGVILDIHFLSQADFLVCTFSSQVSDSRAFLSSQYFLVISGQDSWIFFFFNFSYHDSGVISFFNIWGWYFCERMRRFQKT